MSLTLHQKGNDSTLMNSIWFALFKNYCSSLICNNLRGYTLSPMYTKKCKEASKGRSCLQHSEKKILDFLFEWKKALMLKLLWVWHRKIEVWVLKMKIWFLKLRKQAQFLIYLYELLWLQMKALFLTLDEQDFPFHGFYPKSNANAQC